VTARQPLDEEGFRVIHAAAPVWLQIAMEPSLVTLQARTEICGMRHEQYHDGHLFVIRDKVSGNSDGMLSPFLVERAPARRRERTEGKPHWTYVEPAYPTKAFAEVRDGTRHYDQL
jgi:hypothetical protein